jgi:peptidylprolyl isomerase
VSRPYTPLVLVLLLSPLAAQGEKPVHTTQSGLKYEILRPGKEGTNPKPGEKVEVHYTGWLEDGTKFDSSHDSGDPYSFTIGTGVIAGWSEGVALMTVGSKYRFTIPWKLAYGERGRGPIPPKANLIFEIELLKVPRPPPFTAPDPAKQQATKSGLKYEVLAAGVGEPPRPGQGVKIGFAVWSGQGTHILSTEADGHVLTGMCTSLRLTRLGERFLTEAVQLMKPGARYRFEVPPELCWGPRGIAPHVPPNAITIWELELMQINDVPKFEKPDPEKMIKRESGLKYEVLKEGTGKTPTRSDRVTVNYTGYLEDGTVFDSSLARGEPATFSLRGVIPGWTEGLQLMKEGARYRFTIPPGIGYGPRGSPPTIPPNATLIFVVELIKVGR